MWEFLLLFGNLESTSVTVSTLFPNFISGVSSCSISYKTSNISHFDARLVLGEFVDFEQLPGNNSAKVHVSAAVFLSPTSVLCFVPRSEFGSRYICLQIFFHFCFVFCLFIVFYSCSFSFQNCFHPRKRYC